MLGDLGDGFLLERSKLTLELGLNRCARVPFVPKFGPDLVRLKECERLRQTSSWHGNVVDKLRAARDHTRLVIGR